MPPFLVSGASVGDRSGLEFPRMRLSVLHLRRQPWRHLLLVAVVALLATLLFVLVTIRGTLVDSLSGAVASADADLVAISEGVQGSLQGSRVSPIDVRSAAGVAGVRTVEPVGELRMRADVGDGPVDVSLWGAHADGPGPPGSLVAGRMPRAGDEAVVDVADRSRGYDVGAHVVLDGVEGELEVVGLVEGSRSGGLATLFTTYPGWSAVVAQRFSEADAIRPNAVAIRTEPSVEVAAVAAEIERRTDLEVREPAAAAARLPGIADIERSLSLVGGVALGGILLVVASFFSVTIAQRERSLAVMRATGASTTRLVGMVAAEALVVSIVGIAVAVGAVVAMGVAAPPTFPLAPRGTSLVWLSTAVLVAAVLAALVPTYRIGRVDLRGPLEGRV